MADSEGRAGLGGWVADNERERGTAKAGVLMATRQVVCVAAGVTWRPSGGLRSRPWSGAGVIGGMWLCMAHRGPTDCLWRGPTLGSALQHCFETRVVQASRVLLVRASVRTCWDAHRQAKADTTHWSCVSLAVVCLCLKAGRRAVWMPCGPLPPPPLMPVPGFFAKGWSLCLSSSQHMVWACHVAPPRACRRSRTHGRYPVPNWHCGSSTLLCALGSRLGPPSLCCARNHGTSHGCSTQRDCGWQDKRG